jgi:hypothetical protein
MLAFYDQTGAAIAYLEGDGASIYLFSGRPVAWISDGGVFAYSGRFLGWFQDGWLWDLSGAAAFFTENASGGGPVRPVCGVRPVRGVRQVRPVRGVRQVRPVRPVRQLNWSNLSGAKFFD